MTHVPEYPRSAGSPQAAEPRRARKTTECTGESNEPVLIAAVYQPRTEAKPRSENQEG
jgi:hypothetical protein